MASGRQCDSDVTKTETPPERAHVRSSNGIAITGSSQEATSGKVPYC